MVSFIPAVGGWSVVRNRSSLQVSSVSSHRLDEKSDVLKPDAPGSVPTELSLTDDVCRVITVASFCQEGC